MLTPFLKHHYIKMKQSSAYQHYKANASPQSALLQVDFAENFTCKHQDEIQAGHWLQSQVSIFTACLWNGGASPTSAVVVSDNLSHEKSTVLACLVQVLEVFLVSKECKNLTIFSDGPSSQMKNRFIFAALDPLRKHFDLQSLSWCFLAASHGKGPVDAVGGTAKRIVWQSLLSRRVMSVTNAAEFADVLLNSSITLKILLSTSTAESSALSSLNAEELFANAPKIVNISHDHYWRCDSSGLKRARLTPLDNFSYLVDLVDLDAPQTSNVPNVSFKKCILMNLRSYLPTIYLSFLLRSSSVP
jgi:hypothetical protein